MGDLDTGGTVEDEVRLRVDGNGGDSHSGVTRPDRIDLLRQMAREHGRPEPTVTVVGTNPKPAVLAELEEHGVERALIALPVTDRDETYRRLDRYAELLKS